MVKWGWILIELGVAMKRVKGFSLEWVEEQALQLRAVLRLSATQVLDPYRLARKMNFEVVMLDQMTQSPTPLLQHLLAEADMDEWSGGSIPIGQGRYLAILNHRHAPTRNRATLMEEVAHIYLEHQPSRLVIRGEKADRLYLPWQEKQAYGVGAAALVPVSILEYGQGRRFSAKRLARYCQVSEALVQFRSELTGLVLPPARTPVNGFHFLR